MEYYREITIDDSNIGSALTDFPVYVDLTLGANVANANGYDVHFTNSAGDTELDFELVSWNNSTKVWQGWVKVPSISSSSDTAIRVYYGDSAKSTNASVTSTWSNNYSIVYHLEEDPSTSAPQVKDSTSNAYNGTSAGSMTSGDLVAGKVGNGLDFDGSNDQITASTSSIVTGAGARTMSCWIYSHATDNRAIWAMGTEGTAQLWEMMWWTNNLILHAYGGPNDTTNISAPLTANTWHHVALSYDGTNVRVYVDGVLKGTKALSLNTGSTYQRLGGPGYFTYFDGLIDEARLATVARSDAWIAAEYANQNLTTSFYSLGSEISPNSPPTVELIAPEMIESIDTYYFDGHNGISDLDGVWTDDANAFDGNTGTYAYGGNQGSSSTRYLEGAGTTAPSSGGAITQVRARIFGSTPSFGGGTIATESFSEELGFVECALGQGWGDFIALDEPTGGWSWTILKNLVVRCWDNFPLPFAYGDVSRIEIEVTSLSTVQNPVEVTFIGTDPEDDDITYQVQIDRNDNFDSGTTGDETIISSNSSGTNNEISLYAGSYVYTGILFTGNGKRITAARHPIRKSGSPTGPIVCQIYATSSGNPTGSPIAVSEPVDASTIFSGSWSDGENNATRFEFIGSQRVRLTNSVSYASVIYYNGGDVSNNVLYRFFGGGPP